MQVFKTTLRIVLRHPTYLIVYVVLISSFAVFMGLSLYSGTPTEFTQDRPAVAIIDRDRSEITQGLADVLSEHVTLVEVEDSRAALQEASAKSFAVYMVILPEGFGEGLVASARDGKPAPQAETVLSYASVSAYSADALVNEYLNTARVHLAMGSAKTPAEAVALARADMAHEAPASVAAFGASSPLSQQWVGYMLFSSYTAVISVGTLVGLSLASFNRTETRRRNLVAPLGPSAMGLQTAAACVIAAVAVGIWITGLGLAVFGGSLGTADARMLVLVLAALFAYCFVALAIGFLLSQLTRSELAINAAANISGLVMAFLGGVWVPLSILGEGVIAVGHFVPSFYYADTISRASALQSYRLSDLAPLLGNIGIILLFALAIFVVGLVAGRVRAQSADAGGSAAAERPQGA